MTTAVKGQLSGKHVLAIGLISFAVVLAVNVGYITVALNTFPGEDRANPYVQGVKFNERLRLREEAAALGWRSDALIDTIGAPAVRVRIRHKDGSGVDGLTLTGEVRRPVEAGHDIKLAFTPEGNGYYRAEAPDLKPGQWLLRAEAVSGEARFPIEEKIIWQAPQP
jgi:nitrogen fixation protein FixH